MSPSMWETFPRVVQSKAFMARRGCPNFLIRVTNHIWGGFFALALNSGKYGGEGKNNQLYSIASHKILNLLLPSYISSLTVSDIKEILRRLILYEIKMWNESPQFNMWGVKKKLMDRYFNVFNFIFLWGESASLYRNWPLLSKSFWGGVLGYIIPRK